MPSRLNELNKLEAYLVGMDIPYDRADRDEKLDDRGLIIQTDWHQIIVYDAEGNRVWDAVCHTFSYGNENGLLEIMGDIVDEKEHPDHVEGWLTADEVIQRIEKEER